MMDEVAYRAWLEDNWAFHRFQGFCAKHEHFEATRAYAPEGLAALGGTYGKVRCGPGSAAVSAPSRVDPFTQTRVQRVAAVGLIARQLVGDSFPS